MDTEQTAPDPTPTPSTGPGESGYEERAALAEKFEARVRELLEAHFPSLENPTLKPYLEEVGRLQVEFGDSFGVFYQILELAVARVPVAALADRQALIEKSLTSVSKGLKALQKIHHIQSSGTPSSLEFRFALAETALRDPLWSTGAPSPLGGGGDLRNSWATPDQSRFLLAAAVRNGLNLNVLHQPPSDDEWELLVDGALKVRSSGFPLNNPLTRSRVKQLVPRGSLYLDAMDPGRAPWVNARSAEVEWRGFCSVDQSANDLERIARWAARWARTLVLSDGPDVQAAARARGLTMAAASRAGSEEERAGLLKLAQGDPPITNDSSSLTRVYDDTLARFVAAVAVPEKTGELLVDLRRLVKRAALAVPLEDLQNRLNFEEVDQAMGHVLAQVANGSRRRAATAARVINAEGWGISQLSESLWRVGRVVRPDLRDAERCADLAWGVRVAALARRSPEAAGWQVLMDAMDEAREQRPDRDTNRDTGRAISAAAHLFKSPLAPGREDPEGPPKREAVAALKALFAAAPGTYRKHVGHLGKLLKEWYPKWSEEDRAEVRKLHEAQFSGNPQPAEGATAAEAPPLPSGAYDFTQLSYANEAARASDVVLGVAQKRDALKTRQEFDRDCERICATEDPAERIRSLEEWTGRWNEVGGLFGVLMSYLCAEAVRTEKLGTEGERWSKIGRDLATGFLMLRGPVSRCIDPALTHAQTSRESYRDLTLLLYETWVKEWGPAAAAFSFRKTLHALLANSWGRMTAPERRGLISPITLETLAGGSPSSRMSADAFWLATKENWRGEVGNRVRNVTLGDRHLREARAFVIAGSLLASAEEGNALTRRKWAAAEDLFEEAWWGALGNQQAPEYRLNLTKIKAVFMGPAGPLPWVMDAPYTWKAFLNHLEFWAELAPKALRAHAALFTELTASAPEGVRADIMTVLNAPPRPVTARRPAEEGGEPAPGEEDVIANVRLQAQFLGLDEMGRTPEEVRQLRRELVEEAARAVAKKIDSLQGIPEGRLMHLSSEGAVVGDGAAVEFKFIRREPSLPARFLTAEVNPFSMGTMVSSTSDAELEAEALTDRPRATTRRMYEEFDRDCAPTKVTSGSLTNWMNWWERAAQGIRSPANRVFAEMMAALCRRAWERAKGAGAPLSVLAEILEERALIEKFFRDRCVDTDYETYLALIRVAGEAARGGSLGLLRQTVEFARTQWETLAECWKMGTARPETLSRLLADAETDAGGERASDRAEVFALMAAGDWRERVLERLRQAANAQSPALLRAARAAVRSGLFIASIETPDNLERWTIFAEAFDEVAAAPDPKKLHTLRILYEGPAGILFSFNYPVSEWDKIDWAGLRHHLETWAGVAPNSLAWAATHFSRVAEAAPEAERAKIAAALARVLKDCGAVLAKAPPRPSRLRKMSSTAVGDAEEVALRLVVERARAELAARMVAWSAVRVGGGAAAARDHQAAFFASPAGRGLISYLLGLGWKAAQGHTSWAPEGGLGDRIAREIRLQGGEDLVDGFYREVAAPLFERLSGVGETASTLVRIEATRPAAAAAGGSSEETQPGAERGLEAVAGRDATRSGP